MQAFSDIHAKPGRGSLTSRYKQITGEQSRHPLVSKGPVLFKQGKELNKSLLIRAQLRGADHGGASTPCARHRALRAAVPHASAFSEHHLPFGPHVSTGLCKSESFKTTMNLPHRDALPKAPKSPRDKRDQGCIHKYPLPWYVDAPACLCSATSSS